MSIQSVTRQAFDKFNPDRSSTPARMFCEVEWFADRSNVVIGMVAADRQDDAWSIVVMGRDERGAFHAVDTQHGIETQDAARDLLLLTMNGMLASGARVFPRYASHSR